jgi:hypothetical protein
MELFPAADEQQWEFIKKVIDDCDYYLLIVGGRYGSLTAEGISFTEQEYDYAVKKEIKVIAFLHGTPEDIPVKKSDLDPALRKKLDEFRKKVSTNRLVKFWKSAEELPGLVALSLSKTIKAYPAMGWIRADSASNTEVLAEINELRKQNEALRASSVDNDSRPAVVPNLAPLDAMIKINGKCKDNHRGYPDGWAVEVNWRQIFGLISPYLMEVPTDYTVKNTLSRALFSLTKNSGHSPDMNDQIFQTIKIQLMALGLVDVSYLKTTKEGMGLFWRLTPSGQALMVQLRTVKAPDASR